MTEDCVMKEYCAESGLAGRLYHYLNTVRFFWITQ